MRYIKLKVARGVEAILLLLLGLGLLGLLQPAAHLIRVLGLGSGSGKGRDEGGCQREGEGEGEGEGEDLPSPRPS